MDGGGGLKNLPKLYTSTEWVPHLQGKKTNSHRAKIEHILRNKIVNINVKKILKKLNNLVGQVIQASAVMTYNYNYVTKVLHKSNLRLFLLF